MSDSSSVLRSAALAAAATVAPCAAQAPFEGFTLFAPLASTETYLVDLTGTVVHTWPSPWRPGIAVYLLENGDLIRTIRNAGPGPGGVGGGVQRVAWDGTVLWDFDYSNSQVLSHHDIAVMPNGNILILAWEHMTQAEAIGAGRMPSLVPGPIFSPEHIVEVAPSGATGGTIVWEWHLWDHLIQDFDPTKDNFGVVGDHPELVDINFPLTPINNGDWIHANSIAYDPGLDQILISAHHQNEIWVIDHSTTTAEAAGHTGGNSGKGGDLLYRWGNPQAYRAGTPADQVLTGQHDANWIPPGVPGEGNITIFNNRAGTLGNQFSEVVEIRPPVTPGGDYPLAPGAAWGPAVPVWSYTAPNPTDFFSGNVSGAERLPNGNTLICSGAQGWFFEVTPTGELVWQYQNVFPSPALDSVFKVRRYARELWAYPDGLSASAGGTIDFALEAGVVQAGRPYLLLGSASGTSPGVVVDGELLPLNVNDPYFLFTLEAPNTPPLAQSFGALDATGSASASFTVAGAVVPPSLVGVDIHHAFAVFDLGSETVALASNAAPFAVTP